MTQTIIPSINIKIMISMKKDYSAPTVKQIPMDAQSVMATSGQLGDFGSPKNPIFAPTAGTGYGSGSNYAASGSDLENMINDILTY
jgi:hypothetical protein